MGVGEVTLSPCVPTKGHFQLQTPGMDKEVTWALSLSFLYSPCGPRCLFGGSPKVPVCWAW